MIAKCNNCKPHEFQDKQYGNKMRVMNNSLLNKLPAYTCTVCGTKRNADSIKQEK